MVFSSRLALVGASVSAGFPSPADDYVEDTLDLVEHLISNPPATFLVRAVGNSMEGAGIHSGDLLIVDRSQEVSDGDVAVCLLEGDFTVKRFRRCNGIVTLEPANGAYGVRSIESGEDFEVWGKVTYVIHKP